MEDRKVLAVGLKFFGAVALLLLFAYWFQSLYPAIVRNREMLKQIDAPLKEAKTLGLDFEKAVSDLGKYKGKHVLWCVQNIATDEVFYKGDMNSHLDVSNYAEMPPVRGNCAKMLLRIEDGRWTASGAVVKVRFLHKFE